MKLIGYVSDEMYVSIADAQIEFLSHDKHQIVRSSPAGGIYVDLPAGEYAVFLSHPEFGSKESSVTIAPNSELHQFRLLSKKMVGYIWPKWSRVGEFAQLRFHSTTPVHFSLWRYGWKKTKVRDLGHFQPFAPLGDCQTLPDGDVAGIDLGWNHNRFNYPPDLDARRVSAPETSGLYFIHMNGDNGDFFSFPWVVAPAKPTSDIAVLASTICWSAYNDWGGRSNYVAADKLPPAPSVSTTQNSPWFRPTGAFWWVAQSYDPLTFERPEHMNVVPEDAQIFDSIDLIGSEHLAAGEWRLLGWLEREEINYDLYSENQFDSGELNLADYKVLILNTHPEYWTVLMYEKLKKWVFESGGKLLYLGGNGINCSVDLFDNSMIVHNMDLSDWLPHRAYVGAGALIPSRFERRHENESKLLGVSMTFAGMETGAPFEVLAAEDPIFAGLGFKNGELFGRQTLVTRCPGGASGGETDKINSHTPASFKLLARGTNADGGGAELVSLETSSGGMVYSVGSINWCASLPIDEEISRITRNMITRVLE